MTDQARKQEPDTTEKILAAAKTEFASEGFAGARVDRIAERASVNKAMIYYHFNSKRELYLKVIHSFYSELAEQIRQRIDPAQSLEELLPTVAEVYAQLTMASEEHRALIIRELADPDPEVADEIASLLAGSGLPALLAQKLTEGVEAGDLRQIDIRQSVFSYVLMNYGYALVYPIANRILGITDTNEFVTVRQKAVVDLFLNGVKAK